MPITIAVEGHLVVPFGAPKWDIEKIKIVSVSTEATYLESTTPCVYIDTGKKEPLRLHSFRESFPDEMPYLEETTAALDYMRDHLKDTCQLDTDFERRFVDLYFSSVRKRCAPLPFQASEPREKLPPPRNTDDWAFFAMMPLPQAHLYAHNPLAKDLAFVPTNMFKVDFAFWTGRRLVAVEVDGGSHIGSDDHVRKDRMLQRAGVHVIHILNKELLEHGEDAVEKLLPSDVLNFWTGSHTERKPYNSFWFPF